MASVAMQRDFINAVAAELSLGIDAAVECGWCKWKLRSKSPPDHAGENERSAGNRGSLSHGNRQDATFSALDDGNAMKTATILVSLSSEFFYTLLMFVTWIVLLGWAAALISACTLIFRNRDSDEDNRSSPGPYGCRLLPAATIPPHRWELGDSTSPAAVFFFSLSLSHLKVEALAGKITVDPTRNAMLPKEPIRTRPLFPYLKKKYRTGLFLGAICVLFNNGIWISVSTGDSPGRG